MATVELQESRHVTTASAEATGMRPGTRVEVRRRFDARWARGFEVLEHSRGLYRLRRMSDGAPLPVPFPADDIRPERRDTFSWS